MGPRSLASFLEAIEREINEYEGSALAMVGFASLYEFDPASKGRRGDIRVLQGRRFETSEGNPIRTRIQVTPDLAIQVGADMGSIAELQIGLPRDEGHWASSLEQIRKYDDDLLGWVTGTEKLDRHDIIYLIEVNRGPRFAEYVGEQSTAGGWVFQRPFAVVSFTRSNLQLKEFLQYRLETGAMLDAGLAGRLKHVISVPLVHSAVGYSARKLWDCRPPDCYLLFLAWQDVVLPKAADSAAYARAHVNAPVTVELNVEEVQRTLEQYYSFTPTNGDPRQPTVPDRSWIRSALGLLHNDGVLTWTDQTQGMAKVRFKKSYGLEYFKKLDAQARLEAAVKESQTELFIEKPQPE